MNHITQNDGCPPEQRRRTWRDFLDLSDSSPVLRAAKDIEAAFSQLPNQSQGDDPLAPVPFRELAVSHPQLHPPVIEGLLRRGETANVIAHPKTGKSWLCYGMALSKATGRPWLGTFGSEPGRVLLLDNELHPPTVAMRIPKVAYALGIYTHDYDLNIDVVHLRGRLKNIYDLKESVKQWADAEYSLVIVDTYYRMLPPDVSENDNAKVTAIYNQIDQYAERTNAAWVLVHHTSKGNQSEKSVTDVGAGAGSQSRAADTHLVLRPHVEPGHVTLEAEVRSFPPVDPFVLRWDFPLWLRADDMDPDRLKGKLTGQEQRQNERDRQGMRDIVDVLRKWDRDADGLATPNRITDKSPYGRDRTRNLLAKLLHTGDMTRESTTIRGNDTWIYSLTVDAE